MQIVSGTTRACRRREEGQPSHRMGGKWWKMRAYGRVYMCRTDWTNNQSQCR